jgi:hypothetical protein
MPGERFGLDYGSPSDRTYHEHAGCRGGAGLIADQRLRGTLARRAGGRHAVAKVFRHYGGHFWAVARGDRTEGRPNYPPLRSEHEIAARGAGLNTPGAPSVPSGKRKMT